MQTVLDKYHIVKFAATPESYEQMTILMTVDDVASALVCIDICLLDEYKDSQNLNSLIFNVSSATCHCTRIVNFCEDSYEQMTTEIVESEDAEIPSMIIVMMSAVKTLPVSCFSKSVLKTIQF